MAIVAAICAFVPTAGAQTNICALPADAGPCEGYFPHYFHNDTTGQCELFVWGGCEGNANRFETLAECEAACPQTESLCMLPADVGPCDAVCPRYFHNATTGECEPFEWGCCDGNANNFATLAECESACPPAGDLCTLPRDGGPCDGVCPRYFFNDVTGQCEEFAYGCCGGNANNFETLPECENACLFSGDICTLPAQAGSCEYYVTRYYFETGTGRCEHFTYSQCGGNANNFATPDACETACLAATVEPIPATTAWGQFVMLLLVVLAGTVIMRRRQSPCPR